MARMYSRKKGRHGSKHPPYKIVPKWVKYKKDEIENLIVKLAKERYGSAQIGLILRDQYGIPDVKTVTKKSIGKTIEEHKLYPEIPAEMMSLLKRVVLLKGHLGRNKQDKRSQKGLENLESKIRRLGKYYSRVGKLPEGWKYKPEEAKLIVQK